MNEITTLAIQDIESSDEALAIVRYGKDRIALALSQKSNGDIEIVMNKANALALSEALKKAADQA